jgi:hypothetical protein
MRFSETQRFAGWIRAVVLLPVVIVGGLAVVLGTGGPVAAALVAAVAAVLSAAVAVPTLLMRLVIEVDGARLHVRVEKRQLPVPFLPPDQHIELADVARAEIHTYRALTDREYWGTHFWGLATGRCGRAFLYLMKGGPGVQLELRDGTRVLVGSTRPQALMDALEFRDVPVS